MKNGKRPGNGGFTKEFYVTFLVNWDCYYQKRLTPLKREKRVHYKSRLKKDRDARLIKTWRPISLIKC